MEIYGEGDGVFSLVAVVEDVVCEACRVLGIGVHATDQQLRAAYLEKISQYHPDKVAALGPELKALAEEKTKKINWAYSLLVNGPSPSARRTSTTVRFSPRQSVDDAAKKRPPRDNLAAVLVALILGLVLVGCILVFLEPAVPPASTPATPQPTSELPNPTTVVAAPEHLQPLCDESLIIRPKSGAELGGRHRGGLGRFKIENGTENDAVAALVDETTRVAKRAIYVRSQETGWVTSVPPGDYRVRFQFGKSWLRARRFCVPIATSEFNDGFDFREVPSGNSTEYNTFEVTLHAVAGGAAKTHTLSTGDFALPSPEVQDGWKSIGDLALPSPVVQSR